MYEDILCIIDLELDKLTRARQVLTAPEPSLVPAEEDVPAPPPAQPVAVVTFPPVQRRAFSRRTRQRTDHQTSAQADALSGVIPSRPVFVSAEAVKAQASRVERPVAQAKPTLTEGTLDSLIRDLKRSSPGDRSPSFS